MTLLQKQMAMAVLLSRFISNLIARGYDITLGEVWRSDDTAKLEAEKSKGISNSLHRLRLAVDLNLFQNGKFLTEHDEYEDAGELWKSYSTDEVECCWGGDFSFPDSDHFSISHNGIK